MHSSDDWRFREHDAPRAIGAYGGGVVPQSTTRSVTGVTRGEELFHRPELLRPWRDSVEQKHAEHVTRKEQEIEVLTKTTNDLRSDVASSQRCIARLKAELEAVTAAAKAHERGEVERLQRRLAELQAQLDHHKEKADHQLYLTHVRHEAELKEVQLKAKFVQSASNEAGDAFAKQVEEIKAASSRELELQQQFANARASQLQLEVEALRTGLHALKGKSAEIVAGLHQEIMDTKSRCAREMAQQETALTATIAELRHEVKTLVEERDAAIRERHATSERMGTVKMDVESEEMKLRHFQREVLEQLDRVCASTTQEVAGDVSKHVANRFEDVHTALTRQSHRVSELEAEVQSLRADTTVAAIGSDMTDEIMRFTGDVASLEGKQSRLERAMAELRVAFKSFGSNHSSLLVQLDFWNKTFRENAQCRTEEASLASGHLAVVACSVEGAASLWESCPTSMDTAVSLLAGVCRALKRQYGGVEADSDPSSLLLFFPSSTLALHFCTSLQVLLVTLDWPTDITDHHTSRTVLSMDGSPLFRGLRVGCVVHSGFVDVSNTCFSSGKQRDHYEGRCIEQCLVLSAQCRGGEVLISHEAWGLATTPDLTFHSRECETDGTSFGSVSTPQFKDRQFQPGLAHDTAPLQTGFASLHRRRCARLMVMLQERHRDLQRAFSAVEMERAGVVDLVVLLSSNLRELKARKTVFGPSELASLVAQSERAHSRLEALGKDLLKVAKAQEELTSQVKNADERLALGTAASIREDEYKKKLELVHERFNDRFESSSYEPAGERARKSSRSASLKPLR